VALIIGCGTDGRGDDAAGLLAARRLRALGGEALEHTGDGLALMELWAGAGDVILIDAVCGPGEPGGVLVWDARTAPLPADRARGSTHAFGVAEAVELARALGRLPRTLTVYGIAGRRFETGTAPSAEVAAAAERVALTLAGGK